MTKRPVQYFSQEYLAQARKLTPTQIARFLEDFRQLHAADQRSKLISIKIPEPLLAAFKARCKVEDVKYQTQIKHLMKAWLEG